MDLSQYVRVGRFDLPEPNRTSAPDGNYLAEEASGVTYNWDTDTLFIVGDGGRSVTQVSKTGQLIDTMTLPEVPVSQAKPQGTEFYDLEGITYIGNGQFVMVEERDRQAVLFTYTPGITLTRDQVKTVDMGTNIGNVGLEGLSWDPQTGGFIFVKEKDPLGVFQSTIDFNAGTASNGGPATVNSTNLFDPTLLNLVDIADVFALSNIPSIVGTSEAGNLLILSQESGKVLEVDRSGNILSTLTLTADPGNPLSVVDHGHEGITMDRDGNIYIVNENGGGDAEHPQLWVFAPSSTPNAAPTAIALTNAAASIPENTSTTARIKVADVSVTDDGLGTNTLSLGGADAAFFEVDSTGLYIKAGTVLDFEAKASYSVTVNVDDSSIGATPDASVNYTLDVADIIDETAAPNLYISEVAPWSSGNSPLKADWFEVTNTGSAPISISGWKVDDSPGVFVNAVDLVGVTTIAAGESVIFIETDNLVAAREAFIDLWFDGVAPVGLQIGGYAGSGIGLSTGGDAVNLFDATGTVRASVTFGIAPAGPFTTFDNALGLNGSTISTPAKVGVAQAFVAPGDAQEIGSPGTVGKLFISEIAPWSSGDSAVGADWFELTNASPFDIDITGWKMDDSSESPVAAVALNGVTTIAAGESVIFLETSDLPAARQAFIDLWFDGAAPAGLQFGSYTGGGVGLSTGGDAVNIFDANNVVRASVSFGASPEGPFTTFDNAAALNRTTITTASAAGTNGGFAAAVNADEIGSPGTVGGIRVTEVAPWSSGDSPIGADWFEVTNTGAFDVDLSGWKFDDSSAALATAVALNGAGVLRAGESMIFLETANLAAAKAAFIETWFGGNAPSDLRFGSYTGSGVGLSTSGDAVNLYDAAGVRQASVSFGVSPTGPLGSFDNSAGFNNVTLTRESAVGENGAFTAIGDPAEIGSPGAIAQGEPGSFRLITSAGFVASVAGSGEVFGNNGFDDIAVLPGSGAIRFDGSFARGGDIVRLPGVANDYTIELSGSSAVLTDGDIRVEVPVGVAGLAIVFADGARVLGFDAPSGLVEIGGQAISDTPADITAPADNTPLPTGQNPAAAGRLVLFEDAEVALAGNVQVFGGNGREQLTLLGGDVSLDGSFGRGGDTLFLADAADTYTAFIAGSFLTLTQAGGDTIMLPIGTGRSLLDFDGDARTVRFDAQAGNVTLGSQVIDATSAAPEPLLSANFV